MIVRTLEPNELHLARKINAVSFFFGLDYLKNKQENLDMTPEQVEEKRRPQTREGESLLSDAFTEINYAAFPDGRDEPSSVIEIIPYSVRFDGTEQLMGGVGGVSTLPEYRRRGGVRECFIKAFEDMRKNGFTLSALYPFSRAYYRQFGFENGPVMRSYTVPFSAVRRDGYEGRFVQKFPGDDFSELTDIYNDFTAQANFSVIRREFDPKLSQYSLESKRYIFVYRDGQDRPRGLLMFTKHERRMFCSIDWGDKNAFIFLDAKALAAMLEFAATAFSPQCDNLYFTLPDIGVNIDTMINEGNHIKCEGEYNAMVRVVDVEAILKICRCKGSGALNIAVADKYAPWNQCTWRIEFAPGMANKVCKTDAPADVELDIRAFSSLITGITTPQDIPYMPTARIINDQAPVEGVFYRKKTYIMDTF